MCPYLCTHTHTHTHTHIYIFCKLQPHTKYGNLPTKALNMENESFLFMFQMLKFTESDRLLVQIQAYLDNVFDVGTLLEDAETKNALLEHMEELQEHNTQVQHAHTPLHNTALTHSVKGHFPFGHIP